MTLPCVRPLAGLSGLLKTVAAGLLASALAAAPARAETPVLFGKDGWLFPGWESLTELDQYGIDHVVGLIYETKMALATRNIALVAMVVPFKAAFYESKLPQGTKISAEVAGRYDYILSQLGRAGVPTVDLRPALRAVEKGQQTAFYRADYHWTAWAAESAADAMAQLIKQKFPRLAGSPGTGDKLGQWVTQRHLGDLAERFLTPQQQREVGPDLYTVRTAAQGAGGLLGGGPAPIHVVGNSFVQPYLGFPQKLSSDLDRPVSLTWKPGNVGPYATFLEYVNSPDFAKAPPQVLIWQFIEGPFHSLPDSPDQWDSGSLMTPQIFLDRMRAAVRR